MHHDETMNWVLGGVVLYVLYQWYQTYQASQAAVVDPSTLLPVVSPVPYEGPITFAGPPMSAVIH